MATLTTGDISFISFNADEDGWAIVTFVDIDPNTTIYFTDNEATSTTAFNTGESYFQWISGASTISAGTVIRFSAVDNTTNLAASVGTLSRATVASSTNYGLSATADIVYAFLGTSAATPTTILTAVSSGDTVTLGDPIINAGLTVGVNAILLRTSADYGEYSGSRTGQSSFANYKSLVFNVANWTVDQTDGTYTTTVPNTTAFTIAAAIPTVNLSVSSNSGSEAGTTAITVTATASSAVTGNQTVNLGVTGTGITAGDYTLSNSSITILSGQTTGSVTFTVVDDVLLEGTETAILTISNPSSGITLGTTSENITITDNDTPVTPTVNLSVSSNTGTEAGTTIITVTATASSAVSSNQTVALGVSGTGITTSDYYLSNTTITIPNGQTTGSVKFIVADDAIAEGTETAILTISNPSTGLSLGGTTTQNITITNNNNSFLTKVGGAISVNGAEISAFDSGSKRLFVVAGNIIDFYTVSTTGTLALAGSLTPTITPPVGAVLIPNSVAVKNGVVAVAYAVQDSTTLVQLTGKVAFFNAGNGSFINAVDVGALPDMLTFTPDGTKVLVANEGEPNSYGQANSVDPEGSVSIINIAGGVASATVQTADFTSFNSQIVSLKTAGVRITGPGSTVAQDLEPEYIAVSPDGLTARITLQENNAIAILDIASATITQILPLGAKNYNLPGNGIDASDQDSTINGGINIQNWPVFGLYQPDAIASFSINGQAYYITANEGDSRAYTGFNEEIRVGAAGYVLDPTAFPNAATLKQNANLGRLQLTNATGDTDGDGDIDRIESFGARSFSIWNANGTQVFDSGDQLEQITAAKTPTLFNSDGTAAGFDTRSDNKGPEPEGVAVGVINGRTYAFIGLERTGDVVVYDVSNPNQPIFVQYINTPEDTGTEGLTFISAADSPTGKPLLVTASEVSKTVAVFEVKVPTPISQIQGSGTAATAGTFTIEGIVVGDFQGTNQLGGFYLQEEDTDTDGNVLTSEGIFVNSLVAVNVGDKVRVTGTVAENSSTPSFNQAVITPGTTSDVTVLATGQQALVTPTIVNLPTTVLGDLERYEGMLVTLPQTLTVTEVFNLGRFGEISLSGNGRLSNPTNIVDPNDNPASGTNSTGASNVAAVTAQQDLNNRSRIILDDGSSASNLSDVPYIDTTDANPLNDTLRIGSTIAGLTGVLGYGFNNYRIQATQAPTINYEARPTLPTVGGSIKVGSFNVLNYFNGDGLGGGFPTSRGADSAAEFSRQRAKIISAIQQLNADVVGLIEMENDGDGANSAIADLVNGLNTAIGTNTYAFIPLANTTGSPGTDEIKVALIYKPNAVTPIGNAVYFNDSAFTSLGRPPLAQTFSVNATGEKFTPIVNHFKSKSSTGATGLDADQLDGQGAYNNTRKTQATALLNFVSQIQTASGDNDVVILGDLNAYNEEDPIDILRAGGFTKLTTATDSYVFDGQTGSLDHALVTSSLLTQVTGAAKWNINSSEPIALDYNDNVQSSGEAVSELRNDTSLYSANPFRSSDHDPVLVGLNLRPTGNTAVIESVGNTKLVKDTTNKYFTQIGTATPIAITNGGQQIYQDIYSGWQPLAAETVNGDNQVLWKNTTDNYLHIWHLDNNWNWVSSEGNWGLNSADGFIQETNFQLDTNGDGVIGNPYTSIESVGNTKLVKDSTNKYFTQTGTATPTSIKFAGQQIYQDIYSGWQTLAAETVNGDNQVLWKNTTDNYLHIWHLDNNWNWVSSEGNWGLNSADGFTQETNFQLDTNGDGVIGNPYTSIESVGNTKLVKDSTNKYFAQTGTVTPTAIKNGGQQIYQNIYTGWQTLAAETVNGDNQVLWKNTTDNYLHIWHLDNNWNWVSSEGNWGLNSDDAFTQETKFAIDANGDNVIGNPYTPIESVGNTKLVKDPTNKYFAQIGTDTPTAIKFAGQQIYSDIYPEWQTLAAETVNGDNQVLWKNVTNNYLHIWHLDNNWSWGSSEGQWALNSADAFTQETIFGIDANNDGVIGAPSSLV